MLATAKMKKWMTWFVNENQLPVQFSNLVLFCKERDLGDEYGWKQVHGDVFRSPPHTLLFSALIGAGYQLISVVFCVIIFAIVGELYTE